LHNLQLLCPFLIFFFFNMHDAFDYIQECEELMSKGITGTSDGFDLPGRRLGGVSRQPPLSSLHKTALAAAEKRAHLGSLLPSGPKRLGGDRSIMAALSPIQAAAMAAERRFQDDIWCGSQSCEAAEDEESSSDILQDLVFMGQSAGGSGLDGGSSARAVDPVSRKRRRESDQNSFGQSSKDHASTSWSMLDRDNRSLNSEEPAMWECGKCTLLNPVSVSMLNSISLFNCLRKGYFSVYVL
jgi:hypothetical protein